MSECLWPRTPKSFVSYDDPWSENASESWALCDGHLLMLTAPPVAPDHIHVHLPECHLQLNFSFQYSGPVEIHARSLQFSASFSAHSLRAFASSFIHVDSAIKAASTIELFAPQVHVRSSAAVRTEGGAIAVGQLLDDRTRVDVDPCRRRPRGADGRFFQLQYHTCSSSSRKVCLQQPSSPSSRAPCWTRQVLCMVASCVYTQSGPYLQRR